MKLIQNSITSDLDFRDLKGSCIWQVLKSPIQSILKAQVITEQWKEIGEHMHNVLPSDFWQNHV